MPASRAKRISRPCSNDATPASPFVDVLPPKSHPETRSVRAANTCRIAVHRPQGGDTLVILSVIDNLVKGAAGTGGAEHEPDVRSRRMFRPFASSRLALTLRRLRGRFGISAPARGDPHAPAVALARARRSRFFPACRWPSPAGSMMPGGVFAGFHQVASEHEIDDMRERLARLESELEGARKGGEFERKPLAHREHGTGTTRRADPGPGRGEHPPQGRPGDL
jgi:hypothetical protein